MRLQKLSFALSCVAWFVPPALPAQETMRVAINVTDLSGSGVAKAQIRLVPSPPGGTAKLATDDKGRLLLELKPGGYGLFVSDPGFSRFVTHVEVRPSREVQIIPLVLQIAPMSSPTVYPASSKDALLLQALP